MNSLSSGGHAVPSSATLSAVRDTVSSVSQGSREKKESEATGGENIHTKECVFGAPVGQL